MILTTMAQRFLVFIEHSNKINGFHFAILLSGVTFTTFRCRTYVHVIVFLIYLGKSAKQEGYSSPKEHPSVPEENDPIPTKHHNDQKIKSSLPLFNNTNLFLTASRRLNRGIQVIIDHYLRFILSSQLLIKKIYALNVVDVDNFLWTKKSRIFDPEMSYTIAQNLPQAFLNGMDNFKQIYENLHASVGKLKRSSLNSSYFLSIKIVTGSWQTGY